MDCEVRLLLHLTVTLSSLTPFSGAARQGDDEPSGCSCVALLPLTRAARKSWTSKPLVWSTRASAPGRSRRQTLCAPCTSTPRRRPRRRMHTLLAPCT